MNTSSLNSVVIKEVLIIALCLLLGVTGTAFAGGEEAKSKASVALSKAQTELFNELDAKYQKELAATLEEIEHPKPNFDKVEVYNYEGELLKTINLSDLHEFNEQELLPHTHLLTVDNRTAVYIVF